MNFRILFAIVPLIALGLAPSLRAEDQATPADAAATAPAEGSDAPTEAQAPSGEQPAAEQPVSDEPAADAPSGDQPAADQPTSDQPAGDAQAAPPADPVTPPAPDPLEMFNKATTDVDAQLEAAIAELNALREQIQQEQTPMTRQLSALEKQSIDAREEFNAAVRELNSRTLDLANLKKEIKDREGEAQYLSNLLTEYIRNFEQRLHIAELQRFQSPIRKALDAPANTNLTPTEIYEQQLAIANQSLDRLEEIIGGMTFKGDAVDETNFVQKGGTMVLVGPLAFFRSADGKHVGSAEQLRGSLEPSVQGFADPANTAIVDAFIQGKGGELPVDPTLGNARAIEETQESLVEHIKSGGPVMVPIFALAGAALVVALYKWISLLVVRTPSGRSVRELLEAIAKQDRETALRKVKAIRGPAGRMLRAGIDHLDYPRELIEEVMYEQVLSTRHKLQRMLPFIAITASSAPLLGLLGTVTGIINTFDLITVYGSGDVKTLSSGISEALITTEYGLIVAIPALLLHSFLSRKARGVIDQMEKSAVALVNQLGKTPFTSPPESEKAAA